MRKTVCLATMCYLAALLCKPAWSLNWSVKTVDSSWGAGSGTSIAVDSNGNPQIGYVQGAREEMRYAYKNGSTWVTEHVSYSQSGYVLGYPSFAVDHNSNPVLSYKDHGNGELMYAYRNGSSWVTETVDSNGNAGWFDSMKIDNLGQACISYFSYTTEGDQLMFARRNGGSWKTELVESISHDQPYPSLSFDPSGNSCISYSGDQGILRYAHWDGSQWVIQTVDSDGGTWYSSMVFDKNGNPHISYIDGQWHNSSLKYAYWDGTSWIKTTICGAYFMEDASLALDSLDRPYIVYTNVSGTHITDYSTRVAYMDGGSWHEDLVDVNGRGYNSIAISASDVIHLSYYDSPGNLEYATAMIPEPSSMLALLCGVAGMGGLALRRLRTHFKTDRAETAKQF